MNCNVPRSPFKSATAVGKATPTAAIPACATLATADAATAVDATPPAVTAATTATPAAAAATTTATATATATTSAPSTVLSQPTVLVPDSAATVCVFTMYPLYDLTTVYMRVGRRSARGMTPENHPKKLHRL